MHYQHIAFPFTSTQLKCVFIYYLFYNNFFLFFFCCNKYPGMNFVTYVYALFFFLIFPEALLFGLLFILYVSFLIFYFMLSIVWFASDSLIAFCRLVMMLLCLMPLENMSCQVSFSYYNYRIDHLSVFTLLTLQVKNKEYVLLLFNYIYSFRI